MTLPNSASSFDEAALELRRHTRHLQLKFGRFSASHLRQLADDPTGNPDWAWWVRALADAVDAAGSPTADDLPDHMFDSLTRLRLTGKRSRLAPMEAQAVPVLV